VTACAAVSGLVAAKRAAVAAAIILTACGAPPAPSATAPASPAVAGVQAPSNQSLPLIEVSLSNLSKTLHPYPDGASYTDSWITVSALLWGGGFGGGQLLSFDWDSLTYLPAMARALPAVSADGKTYTFTLRDDVKWSDGTPVTVDDFTFAYDNARDPANGYVQLGVVQDIASFRAPDSHTLEVTLAEAKPADVALGIASSIVPVPRRVWQGKPWNDASANPEILNPSVVLGPFRQREYDVAVRGVFVPVETYYRGAPKVPEVQLLPAQQPTVAYQMLSSGRANWAPHIPPSQYQDTRANPDLTTYRWDAANAQYRVVEFNLRRPFLSDHRVREALARALSRSDILDVAEQGLGSPAYGFIAPANTKWLNPHLEHYDVDVARAKRLLADAGYTLRGQQLIGKDGQPVTLVAYYPTSSAPRGKLATYMQQQYKELGIELDVRGLDFSAYTDQVFTKRDFDISLGTYGGGQIDPDLSAKPQFVTGGQQNVTGYSNPRVDQLYKEGANQLDEARRKQIYDEIQKTVVDDLPDYFVYSLVSWSVAAKKVQGIVARKSADLSYNDALLSWSVAR